MSNFFTLEQVRGRLLRRGLEHGRQSDEFFKQEKIAQAVIALNKSSDFLNAANKIVELMQEDQATDPNNG